MFSEQDYRIGTARKMSVDPRSVVAYSAEVAHQVIIKFKRAGPNFILRRFAEQITYRYRYFSKNVYFANHNNC